MPNDDGLFTQAEVDKAIRERLKEMKVQRDDARDEAATSKKALAAALKDAEPLKLKAERSDEFEAQLAKANQTLESERGRFGKVDALRDVLRDKYDSDAAELLIAKHAKAEDAGEFPAWAKAQADERAGLFGVLLGPKADVTPDAPAAPQAQPPAVPGFAPPAANAGTSGTAPAPAPANVSPASQDAATWAATKQSLGL